MTNFDIVRYQPVFLAGGLGLGFMFGGNWKMASFALLTSFVFTYVNHIVDAHKQSK